VPTTSPYSLTGNALTGTLPRALTTFSTLEVLTLCQTSLQGDLPTWLSSMSRLVSPNLSLAQCSTPLSSCVAGYYCLPTSLSVTANPCPNGTYSLAGASACSNCTSPPGYACQGASPNATGTPSKCPAGRWGWVCVLWCWGVHGHVVWGWHFGTVPPYRHPAPPRVVPWSPQTTPSPSPSGGLVSWHSSLPPCVHSELSSLPLRSQVWWRGHQRLYGVHDAPTGQVLSVRLWE
jgi:hypothetical protein